MTTGNIHSGRFDPYKNFKFRVRIDGKTVAGVTKVSGLKRTTESVQHREGGDPSTVRISPGTYKFEPITLERGVTHDTEFEKWARTVGNVESTSKRGVLKSFHKDVIIEQHDEAGVLVKAYKFYSCWVSEFQALPDLDASANSISIQHIKLEHEGFEII